MVTEIVLAQKLNKLDELVFKKKFFGTSIYSQKICFAMLAQGKLYFRVNQETVNHYEAFRMKPFNFKPISHDLFYEVPEKIINHPRRLLDWARQAVRISRVG